MSQKLMTLGAVPILFSDAFNSALYSASDFCAYGQKGSAVLVSTG